LVLVVVPVLALALVLALVPVLVLVLVLALALVLVRVLVLAWRSQRPPPRATLPSPRQSGNKCPFSSFACLLSIPLSLASMDFLLTRSFYTTSSSPILLICPYHP